MNKKVVVIGGGPGGTACAIELRKEGVETIIVEKESMPRFHIGESMTGECGASVRALGIDMTRMAEDDHPVKHGTVVYGTGGKNSFFIPVMGRDKDNQLFDNPTWQVTRSKFDKMLFDKAMDDGAETIKGSATDVVRDESGKVIAVKVMTENGEVIVPGDYFVDASGQNTFLSRTGVASKREMGKYGKQIGIFGHFKNVIRDDGKQHKKNDTLILYRERFHWAWMIPIDSELVSIGVVVPSEYFKEQGLSKEDFLLSEMHKINPELTWRLEDAELCGETRGMSNYSYQIKEFTGKNFICIGDAHRFIDPIFSLGMHFTLHEGRDAAAEIIADIENPSDAENPFLEHQQRCDAAQDVIQTMLDAFWDYPLAFSLYLKAKKYREGFIDIFAGRVYEGQAHEGVAALKALLEEGEASKRDAGNGGQAMEQPA